MPAITVRNDEFITMMYYPESRILYHQIHKFFSGQTFRDIFNAAINVFQKYGAQKWLCDDTAVTSFAKEDQDWAAVHWFSRAQQSGWKYWAILKPGNVIGQLAVRKIVERYCASGIQAKAFSTIDEARKWLESCK
jgi:hypothetical protein